MPRRSVVISSGLAGAALFMAGILVGRFHPVTAPRPATVAVGESDQPADLRRARSIAGACAPVPWGDRWTSLAARPISPERDRAAADLLAELAARDPNRAMALALGERNQVRRTRWIEAALRGWSSADAAAAAAWMRSHPEIDREGAEAALFDGAAQTPAGDVPLCETLLRDDPIHARAHVGQLLRALSDQGQYDVAITFASRLPTALRSEMLGTAYQYWAAAEPEAALASATALAAGDDARAVAIEAAVSGWAQVDVTGLVEHAAGLRVGDDRTKVLEIALREWVRSDPPAASRWLNGLDPAPELDAGAAAVALEPAVALMRPDVAVGWAESITDPALRSSTLAEVVRTWASRDPRSALNYAESASALRAADRAALQQELQGMPPP